MDRLALRRSLSPSFELGVDERRIPVPTVEGRLPGCNGLPCAPPPMPRMARAGTVDPAAAIRNDRLPLFPVVTGLASNAAPLISPSDAKPSSLLKDTLCVLPRVLGRMPGVSPRVCGRLPTVPLVCGRPTVDGLVELTEPANENAVDGLLSAP